MPRCAASVINILPRHISCPSKRQTSEEDSMNKPAKILVAEDEPITRGLFKIVLENAGYEVILVEDGAAAVEKAASEHPDLVITDGLLPKLHGFLVCQAIKALDPAPKVIISTAIYTKMTYKWEVKNKYQADDLLIKPVSPADLLQCVEKHLGAAATPTAFQQERDGIDAKEVDDLSRTHPAA
jgi:DNA-binding response OmpR family regulator